QRRCCHARHPRTSARWIDGGGGVADAERSVVGGVLLDQRERHLAELMVTDGGADPADRATFVVGHRGADRGRLVGGHTIKVQEYEFARRPAEMVDPGD